MVYKEVWWSIKRCGGLLKGVGMVYKEVWWSIRRCASKPPVPSSNIGPGAGLLTVGSEVRLIALI